MQELEKILEEIELEKKRLVFYPDCSSAFSAVQIRTIEKIEQIIYKYMSIRNHINDGWIPVEKRLPKAPEMEDEYPEFNVMIEGAKTPTTLQYTHEGIWVDDYGNAYNVIACQPLPEPYIPETHNKPENHYPEWRTKLLGKFDKRV